MQSKKHKSVKQLMSLLLVVMMLVTMVPVAYADETTESNPSVVTEEESTEEESTEEESTEEETTEEESTEEVGIAITEFQFLDNGATKNIGDTVKFQFKLNSTSGKAFVEFHLYIGTTNANGQVFPLSDFSYTLGDDGVYIAECVVPEVAGEYIMRDTSSLKGTLDDGTEHTLSIDTSGNSYTVVGESDKIQVALSINYLGYEKIAPTSPFSTYSEQLTLDKGTTYNQVLEMYKDIELTHIEGLNCTGYRIEGMGAQNPDAAIDFIYVTLYATYESLPISCSYAYRTEEGKTEYGNIELDAQEGMTFQEVANMIELPENAVQGTGWAIPDMITTGYDHMASTVSLFNYSNSRDGYFIQSYEGYTPVCVDATYVDKNLKIAGGRKVVYVSGTYDLSNLSEEQQNIIKEETERLMLQEIFDAYEGMEPNKFTVTFVDGWGEIVGDTSYTPRFSVEGETDKAYISVRYPDSKTETFIRNKGETFQLPVYYKGYKVKWNVELSKDNSFLINETIMTISGNATSEIDPSTFQQYYAPAVIVQTPVQPENTEEENVSEDGEESEDNEEKAVELDEATISEKVTEIESAEDGSSVVIDMTQADGSVATVVPVQTLEAAKGKNIDLVLNMGGYSWTINGQFIVNENLSSINLEVKVDTQAVDENLVGTVAGEAPTRQLSLTHNGEFGFSATLTVNMGRDHEGRYGNLYYHNPSGRLEFMNAGVIDGEGNVNLGFNHASDYVVVIDDDRTAAETGMVEVEDTVDTGVVDDTNTGNKALPIILVVVIAAVVLGGFVIYKKKQNPQD